MPDDKVVVVLVDDHDLFTQGLALLLSTRAGDKFELSGCTKYPEEAVTLVTKCRADVAIVDLAMPPLGGIAAIRHIKARCPDTKVLALSGTTDQDLAEAALRAGADGYLSKSADPDTLVFPLLSVVAGFRVVEAPLFAAVLGGIRRTPDHIRARLGSEEFRLWVLLSRGLETTEVANRLNVSERTAKRMVASLLGKLGAANRVEAAGMAGRYGLLDGLDER
ncbi:response regulator transcription factor [Nocardia puris]|uniref:response regulator transcription factor n=1 Tax=Nocardia puris TaxID=208602 RepID=UPI001894F3ED|nr:response regulator transcription factor [Nocardia puris]MBF6214783.1 response regulator transcription factor [Nocardia puris]